MGRPKLLSPLQSSIAKHLYKDLWSAAAIGPVFGVSAMSVIRCLRRLGVAISGNGCRDFHLASAARRRHGLWEEAFDQITEESAYWVGFLMADGGIREHGRSKVIVLGLSRRDEGHLLKLKEYLKAEHAVQRYTRVVGGTVYRSSYLEIASLRLAEALAKFGVVPRKSKTAESKILNMDARFWRGVVDGDGSLGIDTHGCLLLQLVGSRRLMEQFAEWCSGIVTTKARPHRVKSIWGFTLTGRNAAPIITALYTPGAVALDRKAKLAESLLSVSDDRGKVRRCFASRSSLTRAGIGSKSYCIHSDQ